MVSAELLLSYCTGASHNPYNRNHLNNPNNPKFLIAVTALMTRRPAAALAGPAGGPEGGPAGGPEGGPAGGPEGGTAGGPAASERAPGRINQRISSCHETTSWQFKG